MYTSVYKKGYIYHHFIINAQVQRNLDPQLIVALKAHICFSENKVQALILCCAMIKPI
jgi:hypothetical protein